MYVKKPIELADDLESFLYVLVWMAFRFHWHSYSATDSDTTLADLRTRNATNLNLSRIISEFFFEELALEDGSLGGGTRKYSHIVDGRPPIILAPYNASRRQSRSPLGNLISQLYALVQRHYTTIDLSKLTRFEVFPEAAVPQWDAQSVPYAVEFAHNMGAVPQDEMQVEQSSTTPHTQPSTPSADDIPGPLPGTRPLDTHAGFLAIISKFVAESVKGVTWPVVALSKTADQFLGLGRMEVERSKADSETVSSSRRSKAEASKPSESKGRASKPSGSKGKSSKPSGSKGKASKPSGSMSEVLKPPVRRSTRLNRGG